MKRSVNILIGADLIFLSLLILSGAFSGALSTFIYILAFAIAISFALISAKATLNTEKYLLPLKNYDISLALTPPTVLLVASLSVVTTLIASAFGVNAELSLGDSLPLALLEHALLPSLLEEILFRYVPLRILPKTRHTVVISSLFFALVHHSYLSFAYAFVAGCIFMAVDMISESVIPSIVMHLINNALSVLLTFYSDNISVTLALVSLLTLLSVISVVYLFIKRRRFVSLLQSPRGGEEYGGQYEILMLIAPSLVIATLELFG